VKGFNVKANLQSPEWQSSINHQNKSRTNPRAVVISS
jgi:hypothetical protein